MTAIVHVLSQQSGEELQCSKELKRETSFYMMVGDQLYRHGIMSPMMKCVEMDWRERLWQKCMKVCTQVTLEGDFSQ